MNLYEELTQKSYDMGLTKHQVVNEIVDKFAQYATSEQLDNYLKQCATQDVISKRRINISADFWAYHSGCSDTRFRCGNWIWLNPDEATRYSFNSRYYKGVMLKDLQEEVLSKIIRALRDALAERGFHQVYVDKRYNSLDCLEYTISIQW